MKKPAALKLTTTNYRDVLGKLPPSGEIYWCDQPPNLGVYVGRKRQMSWRVRLWIKTEGKEAVRRVGTLGRVDLVTFEEVLKKKHEAELAAMGGIDITQKKTRDELQQAPTLSFLLDLYIRSAELSPRTVKTYTHAKAHADRILPGLLALEAKKVHFMKLYDEMRTMKQTYNKLRSLISAAYNFFGDRGTTHAGKVLVPEGHNPMRRVPTYKRRECNVRPSDPYSAEEFRALLAAAEKYLNPASRAALQSKSIPSVAAVTACVALFLSGCRKDELMGVSKYLPQVEPERWIGWYDRNSGVLRLLRTKTGARDVPVTEELAQVLDSMLDAHDFWLFPGKSKYGRMTVIEAAWNRLHRDSRVRRRNPHQSRHTIVHHMLTEGEGLGPAGEAVGHSTVYMTQNYGKIAAAAGRKAITTGVRSLLPPNWSFSREKAA